MKILNILIVFINTVFCFADNINTIEKKNGWEIPGGIRPESFVHPMKDDTGQITIKINKLKGHIVKLDMYEIKQDTTGKPILTISSKNWKIFEICCYIFNNRVFELSFSLILPESNENDECEPDIYNVSFYDVDGTGKFSIRKDNCFEPLTVPTWLYRDEIHKDPIKLIPEIPTIPTK